MEELKEYSIADDSFNVKRHYRTSRGKEISLDFFLFTCFEEEQNVRQLAGEFPGIPKRYPLSLKLEQKQAPDEAEQTKELSAHLDELFAWYASTHEILASQQVLDYDLHAKLIYPFVYFLTDLYLVYEWKSEKRLPRIDPSLPLEPIWEELQNLFLKHFPNFANHMFAYVKWCHQMARQKKLDLANIPPVGRYIGLLRRSRSNPTSSPVSSAPALKREEKERDTEEQPRKPTRKPEESSENSPEEALALKEVEELIQQMESAPEVTTLTLKPQNSFIRRQQHKKVISLGFASTSVGEGQERAVQILRSQS